MIVALIDDGGIVNFTVSADVIPDNQLILTADNVEVGDTIVLSPQLAVVAEQQTQDEEHPSSPTSDLVSRDAASNMSLPPDIDTDVTSTGVTSHTQPDWLDKLKHHFNTEIILSCSLKTRSAVENNKSIEVGFLM